MIPFYNLLQSLGDVPKPRGRPKIEGEHKKQVICETCVACGHKFMRRQGKAQLKRHMRNMGPFHDGRCAECGERFSSWDDHKTHVESKHKGEWKFRCGFCNELFVNKLSYGVHTRNIMNPCKKKLEYFKGESHVCDVCGHSCMTEGGLLLHKSNMHEKSTEMIPCPDCDKKFASSKKLGSHRSDHHNPCACDKCGKNFNSKRLLRRHIVVNHTKDEEKPFRCSVCSKGFLENRTLRDHMNIHTGARPYQCKFCEKAYPDGSTLSQHTRAVHLGVKKGMK